MRRLAVAIAASVVIGAAAGAHASPTVIQSSVVPDENHNLDLFIDSLPRGYYQFTTAATLVGGNINLGMRYTEEYEGDNSPGATSYAGFQDGETYPDASGFDRTAHAISWFMTAPPDAFGDPPGYVRPPGECQVVPIGFYMCNWVYIAEYHLQIIGANLTFAASDTPQDWQLLYSSTPFAAALGVPEPAEWTLLIAGFGVIGAALRRRRAAVA